MIKITNVNNNKSAVLYNVDNKRPIFVMEDLSNIDDFINQEHKYVIYRAEANTDEIIPIGAGTCIDAGERVCFNFKQIFTDNDVDMVITKNTDKEAQISHLVPLISSEIEDMITNSYNYCVTNTIFGFVNDVEIKLNHEGFIIIFQLHGDRYKVTYNGGLYGVTHIDTTDVAISGTVEVEYSGLSVMLEEIMSQTKNSNDGKHKNSSIIEKPKAENKGDTCETCVHGSVCKFRDAIVDIVTTNKYRLSNFNFTITCNVTKKDVILHKNTDIML